MPTIIDLLREGERRGNYTQALEYIRENRNRPELFSRLAADPIMTAVKLANTEVLQALVELPGIDVNKMEGDIDGCHRTPLHAAIAVKCSFSPSYRVEFSANVLEIVRILLSVPSININATTLHEYGFGSTAEGLIANYLEGTLFFNTPSLSNTANEILALLTQHRIAHQSQPETQQTQQVSSTHLERVTAFINVSISSANSTISNSSAKSFSDRIDNIDREDFVPEYFKCCISLQICDDPIDINGDLFDRASARALFGSAETALHPLTRAIIHRQEANKPTLKSVRDAISAFVLEQERIHAEQQANNSQSDCLAKVGFFK